MHYTIVNIHSEVQKVVTFSQHSTRKCCKLREVICKDHRQESMTFARLWDCHMGHASAFCQTNLTGGRLL